MNERTIERICESDVYKRTVYSKAFVNTLIVGVGTFILQFFWGLLLALFLNELRHKLSRSFYQTVSYFRCV